MSKVLLIVRHAKAEEADFKKPDFKRALSHRGEKNVQEMAKRLKIKKLELDLNQPLKILLQLLWHQQKPF